MISSFPHRVWDEPNHLFLKILKCLLHSQGWLSGIGKYSSFWIAVIQAGSLLGEVDDNAEQHLDQFDLVLHGGEAVGPQGKTNTKAMARAET